MVEVVGAAVTAARGATAVQTAVTAAEGIKMATGVAEAARIGGMAGAAVETANMTGTVAKTAESLQSATALAGKLETSGALNTHATLADLAGGKLKAPNLIVDAKGTGKYVPPIAETGTPAVAEKGTVSTKNEAAGLKPSPTVEAPKDSKDKPAGNIAPELRDKTITDIQGRIKDGTATEKDLQQYRELKQVDPAVRRQQLEDKILSGNFTEADEVEWRSLVPKKAEQPVERELTEKEKLQKEIDAVGEKIIAGEGDRTENLLKLQELKDKFDGLNQPSMSQEARRRLVNSVLHPDNKKDIAEPIARELAVQKEVKGKLERLMALEMNVASAPKRLENLRKQAEDVRRQIKLVEEQTAGATVEQEERFRKRLERYGLYMQLANIKGAITETKMGVPILVAEYKDTMQYVRRRLGVTHGFGAFLEWVDAKVTQASVDMYVDGVSLADND